MESVSSSPEFIPLEEKDVIAFIDSRPIGDEVAMEMAARYAAECHAEADAEACVSSCGAVNSNRADLVAKIKFSRMYLGSNTYRANGIELLREILAVALKNESTLDLSEEVEQILAGVEK